METVEELLKRIPVQDLIYLLQWWGIMIDKGEYEKYGLTDDQLVELENATKNLSAILAAKTNSVAEAEQIPQP